MKKRWIAAVAAVAVLVALVIVTNDHEPAQELNYTVAGPVEPRGDRLLGLANCESRDMTEPEAFLFLKSRVDVNAQTVGYTWTEIETSPGEYERRGLEKANSAYRGVRIVLNINPIETFVRTVPEDLEGRRFDDPEMISRFKTLLDVAFAELSDLEFDSFVIGNEVNMYLEESGEWESFKVFYREIRSHVKERHPDIKVGIATAAGFIEDDQGYRSAELKEILELSDIYLTTLYPAQGQVDESFELITNEIDMPIYIQEIGFPSGEKAGSSELKQAEYVREVFSAWDRHPEIRYVNYFCLHDFEREYIEGIMEALGKADEPDGKLNVEIMTSLGLRSFDGRDKPGFMVFDKEAEARGW